MKPRSQGAAALPSLREAGDVLKRLTEDGRWAWRGGAGKETSAAEEAFAAALAEGYEAAVRGELQLSTPGARDAPRAAGRPMRKVRVPAPGGVDA